MAYSDAEARQELLDGLAVAIDELGEALALLSTAYELLDDRQADALEEQLFRAVQRAYGRAKRTHSEFAGRHRLAERAFVPPAPGAPSTGVGRLLQDAVAAVGRAEAELVALQDSLMPIEVGDAELRAGLAETRELIGGLAGRARGFMRTFGR